MNKCVLFCLALLLIIPVSGFAQDSAAVALNEYIEELNEQCPIGIENKDDWPINSCTMVEDRYALVDISLPPNLSMVLAPLTADNDNAKQLWIKQLKQYGKRWDRLVELLVAADRRLILNLCPGDPRSSALVTLQPSDFKKK